jgi:hypothetical protein
MITPAELQNLVHAFETLEGIEQRIDLRCVSRGSYAAALRSMGQDMDTAVALMGSHGKKPESVLELLIFCFHPESVGRVR